MNHRISRAPVVRCSKCHEAVDASGDLRGDDHLCEACVEAMTPAEQFVIEIQDARRRIYRTTQKASFGAREIDALRRVLITEFGDLEERAAELLGAKAVAS